MLAAIAAIALFAGTIGATVSVNQHVEPKSEQAHEPVVEVRAVESLDTANERRPVAVSDNR
jgi:hypothetical protein